MPHQYMRLRTNCRFLGIALALMLGLVLTLTGCSGSSAPVSLSPDQVQTLHQDYVIYTWTSGDCLTSPPPAVHSAETNQAVLGQESWPNGGKSGFECTTINRIYMAGMRFPLRGVDWSAATHAQLAFRLDGLDASLTQPPTCFVELSVAEQEWTQANPTQRAAAPYAVLFPSKGSAMGAGSAHPVTYDGSTKTVTVDATAAVDDWIAQRHANQGFLFKSFDDCRLSRMSSVSLILNH